MVKAIAFVPVASLRDMNHPQQLSTWLKPAREWCKHKKEQAMKEPILAVEIGNTGSTPEPTREDSPATLGSVSRMWGRRR
ncbi:hypothetical protein V6N13_140186 [Hibiscus sabdariffa]